MNQKKGIKINATSGDWIGWWFAVLLQGLRKVVFGTGFMLGSRGRACMCVCMNFWMYAIFLLIPLSFNVSGKLSPGFSSLLSPLKLKNAPPPNPFTRVCTAIIEFFLFFHVIGERPSPLAIFKFMSLPFKVWMTMACWWSLFMAILPRHTHTQMQTYTAYMLNHTAFLSERKNLLSVTH